MQTAYASSILQHLLSNQFQGKTQNDTQSWIISFSIQAKMPYRPYPAPDVSWMAEYELITSW